MKYSFKTKIVFQRPLSKNEQFAFWHNAMTSIKKIALSGNLSFKKNMEWCVDYSDCNLNEAEAKLRFSEFLERQKDIITTYSFNSLSAA